MCSNSCLDSQRRPQIGRLAVVVAEMLPVVVIGLQIVSLKRAAIGLVVAVVVVGAIAVVAETVTGAAKWKRPIVGWRPS